MEHPFEDIAPDLKVDVEEALTSVLAADPSDPGPAEKLGSLSTVGSALPDTCPHLIALAGYARSGKDELARYLWSHYHGVIRLAYSTPIIAEVNAFLESTGHVIGEENKSDPHYRHLLQAWSMARRDQDPHYWSHSLGTHLDTALKRARLVLVSGTRLPADTDPIRLRHGEIWRIDRPGSGYHTSHANEAKISELAVDRVLVNPTEGKKEDFWAVIEREIWRRPLREVTETEIARASVAVQVFLEEWQIELDEERTRQLAWAALALSERSEADEDGLSEAQVRAEIRRRARQALLLAAREGGSDAPAGP